MKKSIIILSLIFLSSNTAIAREIEFEFKHSLRIPYYYVKINIMESGTECIMRVESSPMTEDAEWQYSKKEYSHRISKELFNRFYKSIIDFYKSFTPTNTDYLIVDGTTWSLSFGSLIDKVQTTVRSPEHDKNTRNLDTFVRICEKIVNLSGLPVSEVLYK